MWMAEKQLSQYILLPHLGTPNPGTQSVNQRRHLSSGTGINDFATLLQFQASTYIVG